MMKLNVITVVKSSGEIMRAKREVNSLFVVFLGFYRTTILLPWRLTFLAS